MNLIPKSLRTKIKNYFAHFLNHKKDERGAVLISILAWSGVALAGWFFAKSSLSSAAIDLLCSLLVWISYVFIALSRFLCDIATEIFDVSILMIEQKITSESMFVTGWQAVRDLSNMMIVLGFVIIGVATTLRIREYEAKKLLLPLIIVALLINFSGIFCGIIIDASNILNNSLLRATGGEGGGIGLTYFNMATNFYQELFSETPEASNETTSRERLAAAIEVMFLFLIIAGIFFYMAIIFLARYAMLAFLFILSPLAFVCKVFPLPAAQKIWNSWWENFIKWSFIGVGGCFSLWISAQMMQSFASDSRIDMVYVMVILVFLVVGFKITTKSSAMGASAVVGLAAGAVGFAGGAVMGAAGAGSLASKLFGKSGGVGATVGGAVGGAAGKQTGGRLSAGKQMAAGATGRFMEKLGLLQTGTTASAEAARIEKEKKGMEAAYNSDPNAKARIQQWAKNGRGARAAAAMEVVAKENDLHGLFKDPSSGDVSLDRMNERVAYARSFGSQGGQYVQKDPRLAQFDNEKYSAILKKNPTWSDALVRQTLIKQAVQKVAPAKAAEWSPEVVASPEIFAHISKSQLIEGGKKGAPGWVDSVKKYKSLTSPESRALRSHVKSVFGDPSPESLNVGSLWKELTTNAVFK